MYKFVDLLLLK